MFKKLVEKATILRKPGENAAGLTANDVEPRLVFHYGIPAGCAVLAYDSIQKILAVSTRDGRIKLIGKDNTQALFESDEAAPSKFLQFMENEGILLNVTAKNHVEVWDIDKKVLSSMYVCKEDITSFTVLQHSPYLYIGDSVGNISVLKLDRGSCQIEQMKYTIPLSASVGDPSNVAGDTSVLYTLPQPTAESKRVLIIYKDGVITLWDIRESKSIFTTGGKTMQSLSHEAKTVTSACWACPFGTKVVLGYENGDIFIWNIPSTSNEKTESVKEKESCGSQSAPFSKLNLGYKLENTSVGSLKWVYGDGKASRLYTMGASDSVSSNSLQVVLLNEQMESRTIKMGLPLPEPCIDMYIISGTSEQNKNMQDTLLLLGKSGHIYAYDDCLIEKHLLQCQSRTPPSIPKEVMMKIPYLDSSITVANFFTNSQFALSFTDEDYAKLAISVPLLHFETKQRDGNSNNFSGFSKIKNLYLTGHSDGAINFWDASCPLFVPVLPLKMQSEDDYSPSGTPLTALYFDGDSRLLISGDQSGMVRIFKFKPEPYASESIFTSLQGNTKKGYNHIIHSIKLIKVNGPVISFNKYHDSRHIVAGTDQGNVSLIDIEQPSILYEKHIVTEISNGILSLQSEVCSLHGFDKKIVAVATKDSSVLALDSETGTPLSSSPIHPKKPSKALHMKILDGQSFKGSRPSNGDSEKECPPSNVTTKQEFLVICSEKAAYVYSLTHLLQGIKKVHYKKKFNASCCWATTCCTLSDVCLILLFSSGKLEVRSLPELSLLKELPLRGYTYSSTRPSSLSDGSICASLEGEIVMVNNDQEISAFSVLPNKETFRHLEVFGHVYNRVSVPTEALPTGPTKEKKKGIFGSVIKGGKTKHLPVELEDGRDYEELSAIFSTANFQFNAENVDSLGTEDDDLDLNIDDIDLDDTEDRPKEHNLLAGFNKQKLTSKFNAFKGKLKQMKVKNEKTLTNDEPREEKPGTVDQIKKRYGFSSSNDATAAAKVAQSKLHENITKLQGINQKSKDMQDNAKSFSTNAKELLRIVEQDKGS